VRWLAGDMTGKARADAVFDFQQDGGPRVIVCNIVAGGTGVTLTAASEAVFVELSWVPGENAQAADRIHRIGQGRKTRVRFLALAGTCDEAITATLRTKTKMISEVLQ
jgi:SNF2 family DNA or RNA helicase